MNTFNRTIALVGAGLLLTALSTWPGDLQAQVNAQSAANESNRNAEQNRSSGGKDGYDREVKPGTMSENLYRRLEKVHNLISEEKYAEAEERARDLIGAASGNYENAIAAQTYGHILAAQEKYRQAIEQFKRAVELDALPNPTHYGMMYNIAQLLISTEEYNEGLRWLNRYFSEMPQSKIDNNAYVLAASANAELGNHRAAIDYIETALANADKPKESWYQLLLAMHFELKEYREAARVLERMIKLWPEKKQYWTQLSSVYLELNEDKKALAILEVAHTKGLLDKESEWMQLAQLYLFLDIPYKGAKVLSEGIERGIVERSKKNLELLGNAWYSAHEIDQAIEAFEAAGKLALDGKLDMRRAYLLVDQEKWEEARQALSAALEKGGLKDTGNAYILLGMSNYELGDEDAARRAFNKALQYDDSRKAASQWLRHLEDESKRPKQPQEVAQN